MEQVTTPFRGLCQRSETPPPAESVATEDGGQRYLEDLSASEMSDKYPAGCLPYIPETERDTHSNAGRDRSEGWERDPALSAPQHHDFQLDTGRGDAELPGADQALTKHCDSRRREVSLDVRLTTADRDAIRSRAQVLRVKPSAWARAVMLDALDAQSAKVESLEACAGERDTAPTTLAPAIDQLRRVGVNLNQVLRSGTVLDDGLLRDVMAAVDSVRASLGDWTRA